MIKSITRFFFFFDEKDDNFPGKAEKIPTSGGGFAPLYLLNNRGLHLHETVSRKEHFL